MELFVEWQDVITPVAGHFEVWEQDGGLSPRESTDHDRGLCLCRVWIAGWNYGGFAVRVPYHQPDIWVIQSRTTERGEWRDKRNQNGQAVNKFQVVEQV